MNTAVNGLQSTVLIVDDERDFARGLARLVTGRFPKLNVLVAHDGREALGLLGTQSVQLMLTDLRMPEMTGLELLMEALTRQSDLSVVVLTAYGSIETAVEALRAGAYDFLTKPIEPDQLFRVVEKGLERSLLVEENKRLRQMLSSQESGPELVGESAVMQRLRQTIAAVAQSDYTVLIRGESGTGKELAARLVHHLSARSSKPFVSVNCPAIPDNLLESELFGHVKGAFTGADRDRKGLFAAAGGGSIHLDEIGEIGLSIQAKLLRVLQDGEVRSVGANKAVTVDARVIATTNQDLEEALKGRTFREDLYYRLNVLTLTVPPLRERPEDIPLLARFFIRRACRDMQLPDKEIEAEVLHWMAARPWPGNVRELQSYVRRLTVFCPHDHIAMGQVRMIEDNASGSVCDGPLGSYKAAKAEVVDAFTRGYVERLLTQTRGNISEAARVSGLSRVALQKILGRMGEKAARFR